MLKYFCNDLISLLPVVHPVFFIARRTGPTDGSGVTGDWTASILGGDGWLRTRASSTDNPKTGTSLTVPQNNVGNLDIPTGEARTKEAAATTLPNTTGYKTILSSHTQARQRETTSTAGSNERKTISETMLYKFSRPTAQKRHLVRLIEVITPGTKHENTNRKNLKLSSEALGLNFWFFRWSHTSTGPVGSDVPTGAIKCCHLAWNLVRTDTSRMEIDNQTPKPQNQNLPLRTSEYLVLTVWRSMLQSKSFRQPLNHHNYWLRKIGTQCVPPQKLAVVQPMQRHWEEYDWKTHQHPR